MCTRKLAVFPLVLPARLKNWTSNSKKMGRFVEVTRAPFAAWWWRHAPAAQRYQADREGLHRRNAVADLRGDQGAASAARPYTNARTDFRRNGAKRGKSWRVQRREGTHRNPSKWRGPTQQWKWSERRDSNHGETFSYLVKHLVFDVL